MKLKKLLSFPKNVLVLSFVSLLNDVAGETIRRLFPLFLSNILGVKTSIIGFIEGVGESTPHILEPISGYISDRSDKRKIFVVIGQILRSSMLLLIFVTSWPQALLVRFLDRTGKGIALAPRDSLLSVSTKDGHQGQSFGLNRAFDNLGATIGIVLVMIMLFTIGSPLALDHSFFKFIILLIVAPSLVIAILLIIFGVTEKKDGVEYVFKDHLGRGFYTFLIISFLFSLGSFSDGFLVLKAQEVGVSLMGIFALLALFTLTSTLVSLPLGTYSDHHERRRVLAFGWIVFAVSYAGFGSVSGLIQLIPLFMLYGIYYGITQGVAKAIVTDLVPHSRWGIAFGLYNMTVGLALLPASIIAGFLWQEFNSATAFYLGALLALFAALALIHILPHPK